MYGQHFDMNVTLRSILFARSTQYLEIMSANMFDIHRSLAMLEVISNQERGERCHNVSHGETSSFQNTLIVLLSRQAVFQASDTKGTIK